MPTDPDARDVALTPVLILLRGAARRAAEAAESAYAVADLLASDRERSTGHALTGDLLWERATVLRSKAHELRQLVTDPAATAARRIAAVDSAHALIAAR